MPAHACLFAAQTFRTKVGRLQLMNNICLSRGQAIYDLNQLEQNQLIALKDTLLTALDNFQNGPKSVRTQLCLAIAALALQVKSWVEPVESIIQRYSHSPTSVPMLLEFLRVLPEEINGNTKIPISVRLKSLNFFTLSNFCQEPDFRSQSVSLLSNNASKVLELLSLYVQAPGNDSL